MTHQQTQQQTNAGEGVAQEAEPFRIRGTFAPAHEWEALFVKEVELTTNADGYHDCTIRVERGGWIDCWERLPEPGIRVLVAGQALQGLILVLAMRYVGGCGERHWYDGPNIVAIGRDVEYWQPLPAPPPAT